MGKFTVPGNRRLALEDVQYDLCLALGRPPFDLVFLPVHDALLPAL